MASEKEPHPPPHPSEADFRLGDPHSAHALPFLDLPDGPTRFEDNLHPCETRDAAAGSTPQLPHATRLGDYQILTEIARGGMGVVFKARHLRLNRIVALKVTQPAGLGLDYAGQRLRVEAETSARLDHPHIVPVYEVGEVEGRHYIAMAFVDGQSLAQTLRAGPLPPLYAAKLVQQVAEAIHYAHELGIIHRDIKPGNIMIDAGGRPRVTDFGLARQADSDNHLTQTGQILGTPSFMAPEQAQGQADRVGPLADVYSLGATLYCALTGRAPFNSANTLDTLKQVMEREPVPPRQLNPAIGVDLDTICLKCLDKRPERRYATAALLAEDLGCFLHNRPIRARPVSATGRVLRWCRRNPRVALLTATVALLLVAVTLASLLTLQHIHRINVALQGATGRAVGSAQRERELRLRADDSNIETRRQLELQFADRGLDLARQQDLHGAMLWWTQPFHEQHGSCIMPQSALHRLSLYWRYAPRGELLGMFRMPGKVNWSAFSPDGGTLAAVSDDGTLAAWNVPTGRAVAGPVKILNSGRHVSFSPNGRLVACCGASSENSLVFLDARSWQVLRGIPISGTVEYLHFSPDSERVITAAAGAGVRVWSADSGKPLTPPLPHERELSWVEFSAAGSHVITASWDGTARVWNSTTGEPVLPPFQHRSGVTCAAFSPNGRHVATAGWDGRAAVWDLATAALALPELRHTAQLRHVRYSHDGTMLATASEDGTARVWDAATGRPLTAPLVHQSIVWQAVFSPDDSLLATASRDGTVRLWQTATGNPAGTPIRHQRAARQMAFSPSGQLLATAGEDGMAHLWSVRRTPPATRFAALQGVALHAEFSSDGTWILATGSNQTRVWNIAEPSAARAVSNHSGQGKWAALGPTGRCFATAGSDMRVAVYDVATGKPFCRALELPAPARHGAFSPDGARIAVACGDDRVYVWDVGAKQPALALPANALVWHVEFSRDGQYLGTANVAGVATIWNAANGQPECSLPAHQRACTWVAFSADLRRVAACGEDGVARVCDRQTGAPVCPDLNHGAAIHQVTFSPDGRWVLTASQDGTAQLWNSETGEHATPALRHSSSVFSAEFSPDGTLVATASADGTARVWDSATGKALSAPLEHGQFVFCARFCPNGNKLITGCRDGAVNVWDVTTSQRSAAEWVELSELMCQHSMNSRGGMRPLSSNQVDASLGRLRELQSAGDE